MTARTPTKLKIALGGFGLVMILATALAGTLHHQQPVRCPKGQVPLGPRCCGTGQWLDRGACLGPPRGCGPHLTLVPGPNQGCVATSSRVLVPGGTLVVGPIDWEAQGVVAHREAPVAPFLLDSIEVTVHRWAECVTAGLCPTVEEHEPGRPVTGVSPETAERFCASAGGRLPTGNEWMFAAVGGKSQRFPWGNSGLVCRRAVFGLMRGTCARGGTGPEVAGNRPAGATPLGIHDLTGNVAEWTREPGGVFVARGGSYRSRRAAELKGWAYEAARGPAAHIGFRCAYEPDGPKSSGTTSRR